MASGLPVVAPAAAGFVEVFEEGEQGLFYEPLDAEDAARAVVSLVEDHGVPDPKSPIRLRARAHLEEQSWAKTYMHATYHWARAAVTV